MDGLRQRIAVAPPKAEASIASSSSSDSGSDDGMVPFTPPDFTLKDLLSAIPAHCYERSAIRSFSYILMDCVFIGALVYTATFINPFLGRQGSLVDGSLGQVLRHVAWLVYAFAAGLPGTGLWVIAHECGHQSFSESKTLNNAVGWVLHSALLVPYHSWRISHAKHHAATGHMTRDQVFVPKTRSQRGIPSEEEIAAKKAESTFDKVDDLLEDAPLYTLFFLVMQQLLGWPMYLIRNASGQKSYPLWTNHFNPQSIIFDARHRKQVIASDIGIGITLAVLGVWAYYRGMTEVARYYIAPYLWVNHWLVTITFLQHTNPQLPHYRNDDWNFQRGALCTVDRNCFGFFMHGIAETHVAHHLVSRIPHYHAWEATEALKKVLGPYYVYDHSNVIAALWNNYDQCRFVDDEGDTIFYRDAQGRAARKVVYNAPVSDSGVEMQ